MMRTWMIGALSAAAIVIAADGCAQPASGPVHPNGDDPSNREAGGVTTPAGRHRVADVVTLLREDHHLPLSFIEGDENAVVVLAPGYATVEAILEDLTRQASEYRTSTIRGHLFLHPVESKYDRMVDGVDVRSVPRRDTMNRYLALLRKQPGFERLIPPGTLGALTMFEPANDPMLDVVSMSPRATAIEHLAELLGDDRMITVNIASFVWGTETADGFSFVEVLPLPFDPPVYGKSPLAHVPDIDYASYSIGVLMRFDVARDVASVMKALSHERVVVREAAAYQLGRMRAAEAAPALRRMLADRAMSARLVAAEALLGLGETTGFSAVVSSAFDAQDVDARMSAITGLGVFARSDERRDAAVAALAKIANDPDRFIRAAALRALAATGTAGAAEVLESRSGSETDPELKQLLDRLTRTKSQRTVLDP